MLTIVPGAFLDTSTETHPSPIPVDYRIGHQIHNDLMTKVVSDGTTCRRLEELTYRALQVQVGVLLGQSSKKVLDLQMLSEGYRDTVSRRDRLFLITRHARIDVSSTLNATRRS